MKRLLTLALVAIAAMSQAQTSSKKGTKSGSTTKTSASKKADAPKSSEETPKKAAAESDAVKEGPSTEGPAVAAVSSIEVEDIQGFEHYAPQIQQLIRNSLALTKLNLTYTFGSADPKRGGMDCSGTIYYVLHDFGFKGVPRQSNEMAGWVQDKTLLHRVQKADSLSHPEFSALQPGDLLFWSGTYQSAPREIPVTHVMIYLGKLKSSGKHVVFGASDGRAYQGKRRTGVSVFDFSLPKSTSSAKFYGFGMIPGVGKIEVKPEPPQPEVAAVAQTKTASESSGEKRSAPQPPVETQPEKPNKTPPSDGPVEKEKEVATPKSSGSKSEMASVEPEGREAAAEGATAPEEVSPAIRVEAEPKPVAATDKPVSTSLPAKSKAQTEKVTGSKVATSSKKTPVKSPGSAQGQSRQTKSKTAAKKQPAPPPSPLTRAKRAAGGFLQDVKRSFPSGG